LRKRGKEFLGMTRSICTIEDCNTSVKGFGWCDKHYKRWRRHGDPLKTKRLLPGEAATNTVIRRYRYNAERRNLNISLSREDFIELFQQNCHYCGNPPANHFMEDGYNGDLVYSGIDRVDNTIGYDKLNVVPCCEICNRMKSTLSEKDFINHIAKILKLCE
jgi:hypothetical protein